MGKVIQQGHTRHICRTPQIMTLSMPGPLGRGDYKTVATSINYPEGTIWECDCGKTWQVWNKPSQNTGRMVLAGGLTWRPEPAKVKRKRLGLKWWQRLP